MKKFIVTILAVFYLGASSGATVNIHYCMGQLIDWGISNDETDDCSNCGMEKGNSEDCCKDKHHKLKLKDSPKASTIIYLFNPSGIPVPFAGYNETGAIPLRHVKKLQIVSDSPPRTQATPAFIRNCSFRI